MKISHLFEFVLFQVTGFVVRLLPLDVAQRAGATLGEFVFSRTGFRKETTLDNLRHAYPGHNDQELADTARQSYRSIGTALFEFLWFPCFTPDRIRQVARIENPETIREVYQRGKGVILLTAHFGNWELLAQCITTDLGLPVSIIVKPQSNAYVDAEINRWRTLWGHRVVPMGVSVREILRVLQDKGIVGIVADQSAPKESVAVRFFGRDVATFEGPAVFCLKTGAPMMIGFSIRQDDGSYRSRFEEIPSDDLTEYSPANIAELTRRHVAATEKYIRMYPGHWMWMHKRWKHAAGQERLRNSA
jgi:KDO2-lipid IV(A) lauroyltransferase